MNLATPSEVASAGKGRQIGRKVAAALVSTVLSVGALFSSDLYLHHRYGINPWGYRGPALGRKQPGEKRIAVLGGSTTWGYGVTWDQSFPAQLQRKLEEDLRPIGGPSVSVINLGFNNEGAYSFKHTLDDYNYLDYDMVLIYSGYNDLGGPNFAVFRDSSPVFRWTGYMPLLPSVVATRIIVWNARRAERNKETVFVPRAPDISGEKESETRDTTAKSLQKQLGQPTNSGPQATSSKQASCAGEWEFYCQHMYEVTNLSLDRGKRTIIVGEPYINDRHVEQQRALADMLNGRFAGRTGFRYVNLGSVVDLHDGSLCWDGMHLTREGNRRIAEAIAQPILDMLQR